MILFLGTTPTLARTMRFARIRVDGVSRAIDVYEYAAGKAVNAARAARTLGAAVTCIAPCGGAMGRRLAEHLHAEFAGDVVTVEAAGESRLCVTAVDLEAETSTELIEEAPPLTPAEGEALFARFAERLPAGGICVLSGSLAPGMGDDFYARCVAHGHVVGARTIVDASGPALRRAIEARPFVVKVNAEELATVGTIGDGGEAALADAARTLACRSGGWVIVTRGCEPTVAAHAAEGAWRAGVPAVEAVSAIGSGDSFAGGLAVALSRGLPMADALALATACATANALSAHAAHFAPSVAEELRRRVAVVRTD